ncbi:MAG: peptidoglycan-binding protein [Chloroflexi bacterium]|nr:peptidoglycan-binding protein [Chloroflexota bacterium]MBI3168687.1 peptidoglycan-binding protein [Chloroflexota bacterium]
MKACRIVLYFILASILAACSLPSSDPQYDFNQLSTFAAQTQIAAGTQGLQTPQATTTVQQDLLTPPTQFAGTLQPVIPTQTGTPCNLASFVGDVTVPDNTNFIVEKPFTKTWRLKNAGTCTWTSAYQLVFDSGERMSGPESKQLTTSTVAPGETIDISVDLIVPGLAGTYKSNWKIKDDKGEVFGLASGPFWVQIKVKRGGVVVWHTYKQGDTATEVYALQYLLRDHGYTNLLVDGIFGAETLAKVKNFQNKNDIEDEDGIVGPETWEALVINVSQGGNGDAVRAVQYLLQKKYGYTLEVDSIFGPITAQAVKDFQSKQGLTADGAVGPLTWQKLIGK